MQVTASPTQNWCIVSSPEFDELPLPNTAHGLRQKEGRNKPFRWHTGEPGTSCKSEPRKSAKFGLGSFVHYRTRADRERPIVAVAKDP